MLSFFMSMSYDDKPYRTVSIDRRGYGRRYTWLPVDELSRDGFAIDFNGSYTRPDMIDIQDGDVAHWQEGGRTIEATVAGVQRDGSLLHVRVVDATPLAPEIFVP